MAKDNISRMLVKLREMQKRSRLALDKADKVFEKEIKSFKSTRTR